MDRLIKFLDRVIFIFLCVLIFCLPFSITIIEICAGSAIALWLLKRVLQRRLYRESLLPKSFLNWPIFLYLIILIISAVQGTNFLISVRYLMRKTLEYLALYFVIIDTFNSKKRIRVFLGVLSCSIFLITIDCVIQYFTHYEFLRQRVMFAGRIAGPFEYPDLFGNYLVMILPLVITFSLYKFKVGFFTPLDPSLRPFLKEEQEGLPLRVKRNRKGLTGFTKNSLYLFLLRRIFPRRRYNSILQVFLR